MQRPSRENELCGGSLISQEAILIKPGVRLSTLCLKTQSATAVCPLIRYPGKILPLESTEYRLGDFFLLLLFLTRREAGDRVGAWHREELVSSPQV